MAFAAAHRLTGDRRWVDAAAETADYIFGKNAVAKCFVTGFGARPPMHIHHRIILGYGYAQPFPGMLVGGPNAGIEDDLRKDPTGVLYYDVAPARQYLDHRDSAATNEICINWNAPLTFVLSFLETAEAAPQ
jgi:endoglucanase